MENIRTFFAITLPEEIKDALSVVQGDLRASVSSKSTWVRKQNLHITLLFLGNIAESRISLLSSSVSAIDFPSFKISVSGLSAFPSLKYPKVVFAGLDNGHNKVADLAEVVINFSLKGMDNTAREKFNAHITLARIRKNGDDDWKSLMFPFKNLRVPEFSVSSFSLYKSDLTPSGPVYTELERFYLS